jgi:hypothetical protein
MGNNLQLIAGIITSLIFKDPNKFLLKSLLDKKCSFENIFSKVTLFSRTSKHNAYKSIANTEILVAFNLLIKD